MQFSAKWDCESWLVMGDLTKYTVVQIVAEMLPISSSGHLKLVWRGASSLYDAKTMSAWVYVIHAPTLLLVCGWLWYKKNFSLSCVCALFVSAASLIFIADGVTCGAFLLKKRLLGENLVPLWFGFTLTACLLVSLRWAPEKSVPSLWPMWMVGLAVGGAQSAALLVPGLSRLATVFVCLRWLGLHADAAFVTAWLVQIPLMSMAALAGIGSLISTHDFIPLCKDQVVSVLVGLCGSVATFSIALFLLPDNRWWFFGGYMLVPFAVAVLWCT